MLKFSIEKIKQVKNEHYFRVSALSSSKTKKHYEYQKNIVKKIVEKYNIEEYEFLSSKSSGDLDKYLDNGVYVLKFEEKPVDILEESVIINEPKIEAETPKIEEPKKEASLTSETLPYGLKSTAKTKKKRSTRKKKTEE